MVKDSESRRKDETRPFKPSLFMPDVLVKKTGESSYTAETDGGLRIQFGREEMAPEPMEMVAASLGACLAMTISRTLEVMREKLDDIEVRLSYTEKEEEPRIFDHFNIQLAFRGQKLSPAKVEKAFHMAEESICPVSVMLGLAGVEFRTAFTIENRS